MSDIFFEMLQNRGSSMNEAMYEFYCRMLKHGCRACVIERDPLHKVYGSYLIRVGQVFQMSEDYRFSWLFTPAYLGPSRI